MEVNVPSLLHAGGARPGAVTPASAEEAVAVARDALARHVGVTAAPDALDVAVQRGAIPQYNLGHGARTREVEAELTARLPGLTLVGNGFHGVGVGDCVRNAEAGAERTMARLRL